MKYQIEVIFRNDKSIFLNDETDKDIKSLSEDFTKVFSEKNIVNLITDTVSLVLRPSDVSGFNIQLVPENQKHVEATKTPREKPGPKTKAKSGDKITDAK